jgi:hypothetical protein
MIDVRRAAADAHCSEAGSLAKYLAAASGPSAAWIRVSAGWTIAALTASNRFRAVVIGFP